jgi:hypothetical protein
MPILALASITKASVVESISNANELPVVKRKGAEALSVAGLWRASIVV